MFMNRVVLLAVAITCLATTGCWPDWSTKEPQDPTKLRYKLIRLDANLQRSLAQVVKPIETLPVSQKTAPTDLNGIRDLLALQIARARDLLRTFERANTSLDEYSKALRELVTFLEAKVQECSNKIRVFADQPSVMADWERTKDLATASLKAARRKLDLIGDSGKPNTLGQKVSKIAKSLSGRLDAMVLAQETLSESEAVLHSDDLIHTIERRISEFEADALLLDEALEKLIEELNAERDEKKSDGSQQNHQAVSTKVTRKGND